MYKKQDMMFFRETTKGKVVVMGRKTLESFPGGQPLKGRVNIVLSSKEAKEGTVGAKSPDELFELLKNYPEDDVVVIGGDSVHNAPLPSFSEVYVPEMAAAQAPGTCACSPHYAVPDLDKEEAFVRAAEWEPVEDNGYTLRFCTYKNRAPKPL